MRILISNDDGIQAEGIKALRVAMEELGEVTVVAPDRPKSATGHSITVHKPLRVDEIKFRGSSAKGYAVNGTPSDCVKIALEALMPTPPDIVISGINFGPNLGTDVLYSGTVSAALEGVINDVPGIAISLASHEKEDYRLAADFAKIIVRAVVREGLPAETLLNVNVPPVDGENIKGVAITKLGKRRYQNIFEKRLDPRGKVYYWMGGEVRDLDVEPDTDIAAIKRNEISVTPILFDVTHYPLIDFLKKWDLK